MNAEVTAPRLSRYLLGWFSLLLVVTPLWVMLLVFVFPPPALQSADFDWGTIVLWLFAAPLVGVTVFMGAKWAMARSQMAQPTTPANAATEVAPARPLPIQPQLEVVSLGVAFDWLDQDSVWEVLKEGDAYTSIRLQEATAYPWGHLAKNEMAKGFAKNALLKAFEVLPDHWPFPVFYVGSPAPEGSNATSCEVLASLLDDVDGDALPRHLLVDASSRTAERPEQVLHEIFEFFDAHADLPLVALVVNDDPWTRGVRSKGQSPDQFKDGYYLPELPNSTVVLVLARRERIERLKAFSLNDRDRHWSGQLAAEHAQWCVTEPDPARAKAGPSVANWLATSFAFARNTVLRPRNVWVESEDASLEIPDGWKPSRWFPLPWTRQQLDAFQGLPCLGFITRPTAVPPTDSGQREPGAVSLARVIGGAVERSSSVYELSTELINTDRKMGNMGAATPYMQIAIGIMASEREGGVSAVLNSNNDGLILITPPTDAQRDVIGAQHAVMAMELNHD